MSRAVVLNPNGIVPRIDVDDVGRKIHDGVGIGNAGAPVVIGHNDDAVTGTVADGERLGLLAADVGRAVTAETHGFNGRSRLGPCGEVDVFAADGEVATVGTQSIGIAGSDADSLRVGGADGDRGEILFSGSIRGRGVNDGIGSAEGDGVARHGDVLAVFSFDAFEHFRAREIVVFRQNVCNC